MQDCSKQPAINNWVAPKIRAHWGRSTTSNDHFPTFCFSLLHTSHLTSPHTPTLGTPYAVVVHCTTPSHPPHTPLIDALDVLEKRSRHGTKAIPDKPHRRPGCLPQRSSRNTRPIPVTICTPITYGHPYVHLCRRCDQFQPPLIDYHHLPDRFRPITYFGNSCTLHDTQPTHLLFRRQWQP